MQKIAIVTGASGNLGQAVAKRFIEDGCKVIGTVHIGDTKQIKLPSDKFEQVAIDLADETATSEFIANQISKNKQLDIAVLTVGGFAMGNVADTSTSEINKQYKLNFETAYNTARPIFLQMKKQGTGRIFLIGSRPGLAAAAGKNMIAYSLAKSLLFHLAQLLNDEAKGSDIFTAVVVPGTIDTPQNRQSMPKADFKSWVKPEQIAEVISFHCSEASSIIREPIIKVYGNS